MVDPSQIREHLEVVGSDGAPVGRVDQVDERRGQGPLDRETPAPGYREFTKAPLLSAGPSPI